MTQRLRAFFLMVAGMAGSGALLAAPASAANPEADALYNEGIQAYLANDYSAALPKFAQACDLDQVDACSSAALISDSYAEASTNDEEKARHQRTTMGFQQQACALGEGGSCSIAAVTAALEFSEYALARDLGAKGCDLKVKLGCMIAADLYERTRGGPADPDKALALYTSACIDPEITATAGGPDPVACAKYWTWGGAEAFEAGDWDKAEAIYGKACDQGVITGCAQAGLAVRSVGNELALDEADKYDALDRRAKEYFRKACEGGLDLACTL